jgi:HSP20 family protein
MAVIRWDSLREPTSLQGQVNRLADSLWTTRPASWVPAIDVFDTKDSVVLKAELPGMKVADMQIEVDDNVLTIKGQRGFEDALDEERYYRVERRYGSFRRSLALPQGVKADEIKATYQDGLLRVTVPKSAAGRPRRIEVKAGRATVEAAAAKT